MLRVGLTGGIACGKSHVRRRLAAGGVATTDLDAIAHAVVAPGGAAHDELVAAFGREVVSADGSIDRRALAAIVFADDAARRRLERLVHPRVLDEEARRARSLELAGCRLLVSEAALLVEAGAHLRFDRLAVVHCTEEQQVARLFARDGLDEAAARARIAAQMPLSEKRRFAHFEVDTSGTLDDTDAAVDRLARELEALAGRPRRASIAFGRLLGMAAAAPELGPRGLSPLALLEAVAADGGLEMASLAARLVPPAPGAWYRAASAATPGAPASALAPALVAWALGRGGPDREYLAAAAASLARLTHESARERTGACLEALLLQEVAVSGGLFADPAAAESRLLPLASRWGGAPEAPPPAPWRGAAWRAASGLEQPPDRPALAAALQAAATVDAR